MDTRSALERRLTNIEDAVEYLLGAARNDYRRAREAEYHRETDRVLRDFIADVRALRGSVHDPAHDCPF